MLQQEYSGLSLYIHIPFCRSKCRYCDFNSYAGLDELIPRYVEALARELRLRQSVPQERVSTIYFGGGTPSLLSVEHIASLLKAIRACFDVDDSAEISLEANPDSVSAPWLRGIRGLGFNRLSLGFQSLKDEELQLLGRPHSVAQAQQALALAREAGFDSINLDLIFGLPCQTLSGWQETLEKAVELAPEHVSLYALTLEEDTPLGQAVKAGAVPAPDPDLAAEMYLWAEDRLEVAGYLHYEISNWARPGKACQHNLTYWRNRPYLGLGAGAHSYYDSYRFANCSSPLEYVQALESGRLPEATREKVEADMELAETLILGLRLGEGVDLSASGGLGQRFGRDISALFWLEIAEVTALGLLEAAGNRLRLTRRGRLLGNEVFVRFLPKAGQTA